MYPNECLNKASKQVRVHIFLAFYDSFSLVLKMHRLGQSNLINLIGLHFVEIVERERDILFDFYGYF